MGIPVNIQAGNIQILANKLGQLVVAPFAYDEVSAITLDVNNTAYNFYKPKAHYRFVVTGILLTASTGVTGSSLIDVYSASNGDTLTIDKSILHVELLKNGYRDIAPLNIIIDEGKWLNAKADDTDVFVTITGYYIPVV